jgi:hypothetical protein
MAFLVLCQWMKAADLYVAPGGRDTNPGTRQRPLGTLEAARDAIRKQIADGMKEDITVYLGAGNYFFEKPVEFDDRDSGRDGHTITYLGATQPRTRIYGGKPVTGWKELNDGAYLAEVPGLQDHYTNRSRGSGSSKVNPTHLHWGRRRALPQADSPGVHSGAISFTTEPTAEP